MKNLQLTNKAFASPVVGFPRVFDQVRARLQRGKTCLDKDALLPRVFDFVLTDAKSFETRDFDSKALCLSHELAVLDTYPVDRFLESIDGTESFPPMCEGFSFSDCEARLPTQSCYEDQRACFGLEDSGSHGDRRDWLVLDPIIAQSLGTFLPKRSEHELIAQIPCVSLEGDSQDDKRPFHSYAGIEFLEPMSNGSDTNCNKFTEERRAQQENLPLLIVQEARKEKVAASVPCPVLLHEVMPNHLSKEKKSHTIPDTFIIFASSSQKDPLGALLKDGCNDDLQMESSAGSKSGTQAEFDERKLFLEESSLSIQRQEHLPIETEPILRGESLKLSPSLHKDLIGGIKTLLVREKDESYPFLLCGPSFSSKLYTDVVICTSRLPFLDTSRCRLPSFDTLVDATADVFSKQVMEAPAPRQIVSQTSQKIYLDWKLLDCGSKETDEFLLQCFQSVQNPITTENVSTSSDFSLLAWQKMIFAESRAFAPNHFLRRTIRVEERDNSALDHNPENNITKERECQVQRDRDPISYFKHLKDISRVSDHDRKRSSETFCAKERVIDVQLCGRQRNSLKAIAYDYQIVSAPLPSSLNISLGEFDLYDSQRAYSIRQELQSSNATSSRDMKERERFGCCLILRQVAIAVIEYGTHFANILLSDSLQKMSRKYPDLVHHFPESTRILKECVAEIDRTYAADHQKQEILRNEIKAILTKQQQGKQQKILILADAEAFFTISTCVAQGGAKCVTQIKDRSKLLDGGSKTKLSEVLEENLKAHNCILWSCEEVKSNFPFEMFSHVFIYSETTGLHVKNIHKIIGAGQFSMEVIRLAMVKESIETTLPQSPQHQSNSRVPVSDRGSLCGDEYKKTEEATMGQQQQQGPCIVVNASGYVSNNKQLMEYLNRMQNVISRDLGGKQDVPFPIDFVLSLSKCVIVIESIPCESLQYLEDYFKAMVSSIRDFYSSCVLVVQNGSEPIQDQDMLRRCLSRIGKVNGVLDMQLLVATSYQDMFSITLSILKETQGSLDNTFPIRAQARTGFSPGSQMTQAESKFDKICQMNPLLVALFVSRGIHPEKAMDMSLKKLGGFFKSNAYKIEQRLLQRIHLYFLHSGSAYEEQEYCSENEIPLDLFFPSDMLKTSLVERRRKPPVEEDGHIDILCPMRNEANITKGHSSVLDLPEIENFGDQRNHPIRNPNGNYMMGGFMESERFHDGMPVSPAAERLETFRLDDFNDAAIETPFSKGMQYPGGDPFGFDPYTAPTAKAAFDAHLQNGSHSQKARRCPSSNMIQQDYIISSDEEEDHRREPRQAAEQIQTYTLYRRRQGGGGPLTESQQPQVNSLSGARSTRKSLEWDSSAVLANWNQYRQQRHYSECTQTFLGRKPKRRKKTKAWGKKKF